MVAEVALATILVIGAALMGKSFYRLITVDPGFDANVGGTVATLFVRDGAAVAGTADAPHGAFSIKLTLDGTFEYAVTYLYDAVGG